MSLIKPERLNQKSQALLSQPVKIHINTKVNHEKPVCNAQVSKKKKNYKEIIVHKVWIITQTA